MKKKVILNVEADQIVKYVEFLKNPMKSQTCQMVMILTPVSTVTFYV